MDGSIDNLEFEENQLKFNLPFGGLISGPSTSGKSMFIFKFLDDIYEMVHPKPKSIVYAYGHYHKYVPLLKKKGIHVCAGLPTDEFLDKLPKPLVLVMDDLMLSANSKYLEELYTKKIHHKNMGVFHLVQNAFDKNLVVARKNSQYLVLMRAPNAALDIRNLGVQLFPRQLPYFQDAYNEATKKPYGYLVVNLHPASHPALKLRTQIFPGDEQTVFIPKNG